MKVGLIYTSTTKELIELVEKTVKEVLGDSVETYSLQDPTILSETRENNYVTTKAAARLYGLYIDAINNDCDALLNICSSVGETCDAAQDMAKYLGVPIVRIDEEMCKEAVRKGSRIAVMATLQSTLEPTKNTIKRVARELGKQITLIDCLVDGAFGLDQIEFKEKMLEHALKVKDSADVILFAQGSMAYCEEYIHEKLNILTLSSIRFGVNSLKEALINKGLL